MTDPLAPFRLAISTVDSAVITEANTLFGGGQIKVRFPNGYGASIIRHDGSYGGRQGLFEVAVLGQDGSLCYTTPVTDDVIGWLDTDGVRDVCALIAALPHPDDE